MPTKKIKRKKLTPQEKIEREFSRKIQSVFKNMGFEYLKTDGIHQLFGAKKGELDGIFLFENILIIAEETTTSDSRNIKEHLANKVLLFKQIDGKIKDVIDGLKVRYPDKFSKFSDYTNANCYNVFYLYFTKNTSGVDEAGKVTYDPAIIVENETLNYFHKISTNIQLSSKYELFRFLKIPNNKIGTSSQSSRIDSFEAPIIVPDHNSKLVENVRMVSFMISAEQLIKNSYVLRKDNWEESVSLYQRLIEKGRIKSIREYVATKKECFVNNIIVSLPEGVKFLRTNDKTGVKENIDIEKIVDYSNCVMQIPDEINSICIIDGQHRIYAYHEGVDKYEETIAKLRGKLHLLVTGLVFPSSIGSLARRKIEGDIFLSINSNARPVPPDVLLHIETFRDPYSGIGIARRVLERLNRRSVFLDLFELSLVKKSTIKISSIVKFALKHLVEINETKETFYKYWADKDREKIKSVNPNNREREEKLEEYIQFITTYLDVYFSAIQNVFKDQWLSPDSKILSITSINGFILALKRSLGTTGLQANVSYYIDAFKRLNTDFTNGKFPHASSQWNLFSEEILEKSFGIKQNNKNTKEEFIIDSE